MTPTQKISNNIRTWLNAEYSALSGRRNSNSMTSCKSPMEMMMRGRHPMEMMMENSAMVTMSVDELKALITSDDVVRILNINTAQHCANQVLRAISRQAISDALRDVEKTDREEALKTTSEDLEKEWPLYAFRQVNKMRFESDPYAIQTVAAGVEMAEQILESVETVNVTSITIPVRILADINRTITLPEDDQKAVDIVLDLRENPDHCAPKADLDAALRRLRALMAAPNANTAYMMRSLAAGTGTFIGDKEPMSERVYAIRQALHANTAQEVEERRKLMHQIFPSLVQKPELSPDILREMLQNMSQEDREAYGAVLLDFLK